MTDAVWAGTVTVTGRERAELEAYAARPLDPRPRGAGLASAPRRASP